MLGNSQPHVEPDEIRRAQRAHGVAVAQFHGPVDGFSVGHALFEHADRLQPKCDAEPTRSESR